MPGVWISKDDNIPKSGYENVTIGKNTRIYTSLKDSITFHNNTLKIGNYCSIHSGVKFLDYGTMMGTPEIFKFISAYPFEMIDEIRIAEKDDHENVIYDGPEYPEESKVETIIGNDVYIGPNSFILQGVHIGDGAVIEPASVVRNDVAPYSIVSGNPAKEIRKRFDDEMIELLEKLKWWNKSNEEIRCMIKPIFWNRNLNEVKMEIRKLLEQK